MQDGEFILPRTSTTWIERYREAGEFTVVGNAYSGIRSQMPIGSFISHTDTDEIMMVETHQIRDDGVADPVVTITGRSIEAPILENRIVGSDIVYPTVGEPVDYVINNWDTWNQAKILIANHIIAANIEHDHKSAIPYFRVSTSITGSAPGTKEQRTIAREPVYGELLKILAVDQLGIKVRRPKNGLTDTTFTIHRGTDRSRTVVFSWAAGDISNADYLWSNRKMKNAAFIVGKWLQTFVDTSKTGIDRRVMKVDASDIDQAQSTVPTGTARTLLIAAMKVRGKEALAKQKEVVLASAQANQNAQRPIFRREYDVGDVVSVTGEFNTESKMRVTEHVEIEDDQNGILSYPTLSLLADEQEGVGSI